MKKENFTPQELFLYAIGVNERTKENFLSDMVRAKCLYSSPFLNAFFAFCFPSKKGVKVYAIDREISFLSDEGIAGRNDFKIYTDDGIYIVESKILDENISNCKKYLTIAEPNKIVYIISSSYKGESYERIIKELEDEKISCRLWEDFINECIENENRDFAIVASAILNYNKVKIMPKKPNIDNEEINKMRLLCDDFMGKYFKNDSYKKQSENEEDEWNRDDGYSYGFTIWASVWFGIIWCPIKGPFFSFAYSDGGLKVIDERKCNFHYIHPLGLYMKGKDRYSYFEVNKNGRDITMELLDKSFREFADMIKVLNCERKEIPLIEFVNYGTNL